MSQMWSRPPYGLIRWLVVCTIEAWQSPNQLEIHVSARVKPRG